MTRKNRSVSTKPEQWKNGTAETVLTQVKGFLSGVKASTETSLCKNGSKGISPFESSSSFI
jgi:hypothetical protein